MERGQNTPDASETPSDQTERETATRLVRRRARRRRRRRWIALAVVGALLVGLGTALLAPRLGERLVRTRVLPALEKRFRRRIRVERMRGSTGRLVLENVRVEGGKDCAGKPLIQAERVILTYAFWPLLRGKLQLKSLTVVRPRFCLRRHADGTDNVTDLIRRLARRPLGSRVEMSLSAVTLRHGALEGHDELRGLHLEAPVLDAELRPGGRSVVTLGQVWLSSRRLSPLQAKQVQVAFRTRLGQFKGWPEVTFTGARLQLHDRLVLTDMAGRITAAKGRLQVKLKGGYGDVEQTLWRATVRARLAGLLDPRRAEVELWLKADRFSLDKLAPILPKRLIPNPGQAQLSADLTLVLAKGRLTFAGSASLAGLTVRDPYLSRLPVEKLGFEGHVKGSYLVARDLLRIEHARLKLRRLQVELTAEVLRLRGKPRIKIALTIPRTRCSHVLDAIPRGMIPRLAKMRVTGWFGMKVEAEADFHYLTTSSVFLDGRVDARGCRVTSASWDISAARLAGPFGHEQVGAGNRIGFEVGPDNPDFVPLSQVSPHVIRAILTTEDSRFFYHRGFIPREFQTALARNLIAHRFVFGASSITMQMVKNVILGREKTLSRKLQELILTWYLERHLSKDRILEIYLNVVELGPGIFGIGRAAWHLFGKDASALEPQEAAYLASILPSPKRHYKKFCRGQVSRLWRRWVDRILRIMHRRKRLEKSQLDLALVSPIQFSEQERSSWAACMARLDRFRSRGRSHRRVVPRPGPRRLRRARRHRR
jgi:hypothetical protein